MHFFLGNRDEEMRNAKGIAIMLRLYNIVPACYDVIVTFALYQHTHEKTGSIFGFSAERERVHYRDEKKRVLSRILLKEIKCFFMYNDQNQNWVYKRKQENLGGKIEEF